jgi:hypothetical protein
MGGEVFTTFVVAVSVYDANFTAIAASINVRFSDDLMNGNCPQAAAWCAMPQAPPIVFSLTKQQLKTHQTLLVCLCVWKEGDTPRDNTTRTLGRC